MKKFLFFIAISSIGFGAIAQGNSQGKGKGKKDKSEKKYNKDQKDRYDDDDDRYEKKDRNNDGIYRNDNERNDRNGNENGKYSKNVPRKVGDAFYRDYPNADNVRWTKDRGVWTARFNSGGIFGTKNSVSYQANGQRVGSNNNNVFGGTRNRDRDRRTTEQRRTNDGTIWDRVTKKPQ